MHVDDFIDDFPEIVMISLSSYMDINIDWPVSEKARESLTGHQI